MAKEGKLARQSDIARAAGVSQTTVSLILTGRAVENSIPQSTQDRVRATMRELGYVPNVAARSLRGGRNGLIGVHTYEAVFPVTSEDYFNEFLVGIEQQAVEMGVDLVLFASTQGPDGTRHIYGNGANRLRLADGAVLLGVESNDDELERLAGEGFPFVFIGRRDKVSSLMPYVVPDYDRALRDVISQLTDVGHGTLAYIGNLVRTNPQEDRLHGFITHARLAGVPAAQPLFLSPSEFDEKRLAALVEAGVTAILVESWELAVAMTAAAAKAGIDIPTDVSMVCLDVGPRSMDAPNWSHIQVPRRELGRRAVYLLMELLDGRIANDHHELLPIAPPSFATIAQPLSTSQPLPRASS